VVLVAGTLAEDGPADRVRGRNPGTDRIGRGDLRLSGAFGLALHVVQAFEGNLKVLSRGPCTVAHVDGSCFPGAWHRLRPKESSAQIRTEEGAGVRGPGLDHRVAIGGT